jgi:hypothetical protein
MHIGNATTKSKTEATYFPLALNSTTKLNKDENLPDPILLNGGRNNIHFLKTFR